MSAVKAPGKWIRDLEADLSLVEAARRVLKIRLRAVEMMLPLADRRADEDDEHVHQLRVATRRSGAALEIFRPCLGPGRWRKARKRLRRLRRAAGAARECDVHRVLLSADRTRINGNGAEVVDQVLARLDDERREAQKAIRRVARRYSVKRLRRGHRKLIGSLRTPKPSGTAVEGGGAGKPRRTSRLADAADDTMPALVEQMRSAASADLRVLENLHRMRITGKRLRYALEIFASCFDERFGDIYACVEALQEHLGAINDSHDMVARIEAFAATGGAAAGPEHGPRPEVRETIDFYLHQRGERVARFLDQFNGGARDRLFAALGQLEVVTTPAAKAAGSGPAGAAMSP
jgi:CHAD domain-containing protein